MREPDGKEESARSMAERLGNRFIYCFDGAEAWISYLPPKSVPSQEETRHEERSEP
jgi:hypothetical protein